MITFSLIAHSQEYICTFIDGECVVEFGDYGKAPNQYVTEVGNLNEISSVIVTDYQGNILITNEHQKPPNPSVQLPD